MYLKIKQKKWQPTKYMNGKCAEEKKMLKIQLNECQHGRYDMTMTTTNQFHVTKTRKWIK